MIEKMTKYSFVLLSADKDKFLADLAALGVMDITRSVKPVDAASNAILAEATAIKKQIAQLEAETSEELTRLREEIAAEKRKLQAALPWGDFSKEAIAGLQDKGLQIHFHQVSSKKFNSAWENEVPLQVISDNKDQVYFITILEDGAQMPAAIANCEVAAPEATAAELEAGVKRLEETEEACLQEIREAKERDIPVLKKEYDNVMVRLDKYLASASADTAAEDTLSVFVGFAPTSEDARLEEAIGKLDAFCIKEKATVADNPPIRLKNNWFARNFETLTGMYGMPVYDEFDPTPVLAPFFLLFWSLCMGDAGYGLLLIALGLLLKKGNFDLLGLHKHWRLVTTLGVGTLVVGFFLGTFFGISLKEVTWIPESVRNLMLVGQMEIGGSSYDVAMVAAIAIGVFHICLAMVIKAIGTTKRFGFKQAISTWGWVVLIIGGLAVAALALTQVLDAKATKIAIIAVGAIAVLGIFIFNKPGRNPLLNVGAGLWDTYQMATGLLGDVLSYIRLFALGLAGGMLGKAFNDLGGMVLGSNPTWQWVFFVLILLIGHVLNFAMSCLGAFVHPLRLTFVEYFKNSGYEGKGVKYKPLSEEIK